MNTFITTACCALLFTSSVTGQTENWPSLKNYTGAHINKIAMPVGGIGTGAISIGGNGEWKDVEMMNKPGVGFYGAVNPKQAPCFMIYTQNAAGKKKAKALMGPVPEEQYAGQQGSLAANHGLPRFSSASFHTAYPFAMVNLEDEGMPVSAQARVFNPFIPADAVSSGIPIAVIRYLVKNKTAEPLTVSVAGSLDNFIGMDGSDVEFDNFDRSLRMLGASNNKNQFRRTSSLAGIYMTSDSVPVDSKSWGTIALSTNDIQNGYDISYRTEFDPKGWNANMNDMWTDFADDGKFKDTTFEKKINSPRAGLSVQFQLAAGESKEIQFFLTWNFPNRKDWDDKQTIGNYYSTLYKDAWSVAEKTLPDLPRLEKGSLQFVKTLLNSNYPDVVKEAALFNSSTLRSQTTFRNKEGYFFGWEGVFASTGSCYGNCIHVWNYEQASPFLFGSLAMKMREVEYIYGLNDSTGLMSFRIELPLQKNSSWKTAAADGQMGSIMKVYREWQLSGDDAFLKRTWDGVKKALSFAWIKGGWDADMDGVMEGCQHNTMDIEYYGPNPEIEFWYLGALKAAAAMARHLQDKKFEALCNRLFDQGSKWTDANLFNGEYYRQLIQPIASKDLIAPGLLIGMGSANLQNPDFQIGDGCLVDQLTGQNMAHICGLGYLADSNKIKKAFQSIIRYNRKKSFGDVFNNMRSYALGNESGLILTSYPEYTKPPAIPLSYAYEAWTGLEYTAASGMIYENMEQDAIAVIQDVRNRYNGQKRNPFNEEECGYHYVRAMASWGTIIALSDFNYSAVEKKFSVTSKPGNYFWSNGYSWGNVEVGGKKATITVLYGSLDIRSVELKNTGILKMKKNIRIDQDGSRTFDIR